jgi:hypothetical protein
LKPLLRWRSAPPTPRWGARRSRQVSPLNFNGALLKPLLHFEEPIETPIALAECTSHPKVGRAPLTAGEPFEL